MVHASTNGQHTGTIVQVIGSTFDAEFQKRMLSNVILAGGGSQMRGLDRLIEDDLQQDDIALADRMKHGRQRIIVSRIFRSASGSPLYLSASLNHNALSSESLSGFWAARSWQCHWEWQRHTRAGRWQSTPGRQG